ncbi:MAG: PASTA domain-containing protein, partial [Candidatus Nanopelagicales bacterium]
DQVNLVISKGPPPITVPRVVTLDRAAAVAQLEALGLKVVVKNQLPVVVFQRVYSQDPEPGTVVAKGSTVTLTLV